MRIPCVRSGLDCAEEHLAKSSGSTIARRGQRVSRGRIRDAALAVLVLAGCTEAAVGENTADAAAPQERLVRWVGAVEGSDVRVAAVLGAGRARLYFCGGAETRWFELQFHDEHLEFEDDAWRIHAHLTAGGVLGEVEHASTEVRMFNAQPSELATIAGLYEGRADCGRVGLIVTQPSKNDAPTAHGACIGETVQPVTALEPIALTDGQIMVRTSGGEVAPLRAATLEPR
jgi:hypothetical protein